MKEKECNNCKPPDYKNIERYPMGYSQPVQLDCRDVDCKFHVDAKCINPSPAITIGKVTICWSKTEETN